MYNFGIKRFYFSTYKIYLIRVLGYILFHKSTACGIASLISKSKWLSYCVLALSPTQSLTIKKLGHTHHCPVGTRTTDYNQINLFYRWPNYRTKFLLEAFNFCSEKKIAAYLFWYLSRNLTVYRKKFVYIFLKFFRQMNIFFFLDFF